MKKNFFSTLTLFIALQINAQTTSLKVTAAGDVGIGTDNPSEKLEVDGIVKSTGETIKPALGRAITLYEQTNRAAVTFGVDWHGGMAFDDDYNFRFFTGPRNYIVDTRNILISTNNGGKLLMDLTGAGNVGIGKFLPTERLEVSGNVLANAYNTPSDARLKTNVSNFTDGLNVISKLNPISYNYNGKAGLDTERRYISIYAQELEEAAPYMVENFTYSEVDERGDVASEETYLQIHDSEIKYLLINAVKEQQQMIEDLKEEIDLLKGLVISNNNEIQSGSLDLNNKSKASLGQNYPNPFETETTILYYIPETAKSAKIVITGVNGQIVREVVISERGNAFSTINTADLTQGNYNYSLFVDNDLVNTKQMVLVK